MDFSIIESLTDEELNELYDGNVIKDPYNKYLGGCHCQTDPYDNRFVIDFGEEYLNRIYSCTGIYKDCGYCALGLEYEAKCITWCTQQHAFRFWFFDSDCYCSKYNSNAYWAYCSR